jgi:hypothetical protein
VFEVNTVGQAWQRSTIDLRQQIHRSKVLSSAGDRSGFIELLSKLCHICRLPPTLLLRIWTLNNWWRLALYCLLCKWRRTRPLFIVFSDSRSMLVDESTTVPHSQGRYSTLLIIVHSLKPWEKEAEDVYVENLSGPSKVRLDAWITRSSCAFQTLTRRSVPADYNLCQDTSNLKKKKLLISIKR